jgi:hypothetical protein
MRRSGDGLVKLKGALFVAAVGVASLPFSATAGQVLRDRIERSVTVPVRASGSGMYKVLYSVGPVSVPAYGVADIRAQTMLTNNCGGNVGVGRRIIRAASPSYTNGIAVTPMALENITPDEHHGILVLSGLDQAGEQGYTGVYYNLVVYAVSSTSPCNESDLLVEGQESEGGGEIVVEVR